MKHLECYNQLVEIGYDAQEAKLITKVIIEDIINEKYYNVLIHGLDQNQIAIWSKTIERLSKHEPIQYITGKTIFCGVALKVSPAVLIPRPETEDLVFWIKSTLKGSTQSLLDIGTGSGAIAIAIKHFLPALHIKAIDISKDALEIAKANSNALGLNIEYEQVDILTTTDNTMFQKFDCIVSNPPYITPTEIKEMEAKVLDFEPHLALFATENDALIFYKAILNYAKTHLNDGGSLFFECNTAKVDEVEDLIKTYGFFYQIQKKADRYGRPRMIMATKR